VVAPQLWRLDARRGHTRRICNGGGEDEAWSVVAERFVGQTADDGIANDHVATAPTAPVISSVGPAFQKRLVPGDVLAGAGQIEGVESAECREVRRRESRLGHVEVFRMDGVGTSIIGRPRRLSEQRLAVSENP
jgi:hypothetical protein